MITTQALNHIFAVRLLRGLYAYAVLFSFSISIQSLPQENKQTNGTVIRCKEITQLSILYTGEVVAKKGEGKKTMGLDESLLNMSANKSNGESAFTKENEY